MVNTYDLSKPEELPVGTLRKLNYKNAIDEVLWIWQKKSNNINDLNSHIWDSWADPRGSIGAAYGFQIKTKLRKAMTDIVPSDDKTMTVCTPEFLDQTDYVIHELIHNKYSRRILTDLYSVDQTNIMGLDPCCYGCTWNVTPDENGVERLNLLLNQRSQDMIVANNWNVFQYSILLMMFAYTCGLKPGKLIHVIADAHIYDRHIEIAKELLEKEGCDVPLLRIDLSDKKQLDPETFYKFKVDDFDLLDYRYNTRIKKIPVAV